MIPDANKWSYSNLIKQNKNKTWKSIANLSGLRLTSTMIIGKQMPNYMGLQWILTYDNKLNQRAKRIWVTKWNGLTLYPFQIIGTMAKEHGLTIVLNGQTQMCHKDMQWWTCNNEQSMMTNAQRQTSKHVQMSRAINQTKSFSTHYIQAIRLKQG